MEKQSQISLPRPGHKPGFTLAELMVSVFIMGLISTAAVLDLRLSRQKDELNTAARVLASDLRSLQNRGLTAQNVGVCSDVSLQKVVCENDTSKCVLPVVCNPLPPFGVGMYLSVGSSTYDMFADVDPSKNDWKETDNSERFMLRDLAQSGGPNVVIDGLITNISKPSANVSFQRQNGAMGIDACYAPGCTDPVTLRIELRHTISNEIKEVSLNAITGRISIQ